MPQAYTEVFLTVQHEGTLIGGKAGIFLVETASCINRRKFCFHPQSVAVKMPGK